MNLKEKPTEHPLPISVILKNLEKTQSILPPTKQQYEEECAERRHRFELYVERPRQLLRMSYGELNAALFNLFRHPDLSSQKQPYQNILPEEWLEFKAGIKEFPYTDEVRTLKTYCDQGRLILEPYPTIGHSWDQLSQATPVKAFPALDSSTEHGWILLYIKALMRKLQKVSSRIIDRRQRRRSRKATLQALKARFPHLDID
ncbi:hypothetical protein [Adonisia turfae]|uniref:Uncharacterized protein n=1 Tax=Adonisia turfae CCMR0081 TaxID=2292702 RepID=A0A6M0RXW9_9CYAN|nr:hypothetical protein [Adonisia turfae]NEZ61039.1 hypothetical protein [Adonisia turfae CCMR0081]